MRLRNGGFLNEFKPRQGHAAWTPAARPLTAIPSTTSRIHKSDVSRAIPKRAAIPCCAKSFAGTPSQADEEPGRRFPSSGRKIPGSTTPLPAKARRGACCRAAIICAPANGHASHIWVTCSGLVRRSLGTSSGAVVGRFELDRRDDVGVSVRQSGCELAFDLFMGLNRTGTRSRRRSAKWITL
jgi:hypothetical protein